VSSTWGTWGAFFVDKNTRRCFLFDPMKLQSNIAALANAVRTVVDPMLDMTDQLQLESITGCVQQDSSSCGVWSLAVLELLLFGATPESWADYWDDSLYEVLGFLRMRYLHKILRLQSDCTGL